MDFMFIYCNFRICLPLANRFFRIWTNHLNDWDETVIFWPILNCSDVFFYVSSETILLALAYYLFLYFHVLFYRFLSKPFWFLLEYFHNSVSPILILSLLFFFSTAYLGISDWTLCTTYPIEWQNQNNHYFFIFDEIVLLSQKNGQSPMNFSFLFDEHIYLCVYSLQKICVFNLVFLLLCVKFFLFCIFRVFGSLINIVSLVI